MRKMFPKFSQSGFSIIELVLVVIIVGLIVLLLTNLPSSFSLVSNSKYISTANEIASYEIESIRSKDYSLLADGSSQITNARLSNLPTGSGNITIEPCPVEICLSNEQMKKITVEVSWKEQKGDQKIMLVTLVTEGGLK